MRINIHIYFSFDKSKIIHMNVLLLLSAICLFGLCFNEIVTFLCNHLMGLNSNLYLMLYNYFFWAWGLKLFLFITASSSAFWYMREKAHRPFRCLDCQYRRELVRVYLSNVEQICRRFIEDRKEKFSKLIEDKVRWSRSVLF